MQEIKCKGIFSTVEHFYKDLSFLRPETVPYNKVLDPLFCKTRAFTDVRVGISASVAVL
jgi:hypothetical protein